MKKRFAYDLITGGGAEHDVGEVVTGLFCHYDMPCTAETAGALAVMRLFRNAYRAHRGQRISHAAQKRIIADVRDYLRSQNLPDYVMRAWIARDGEEVVARHLAIGSKPSVDSAAV